MITDPDENNEVLIVNFSTFKQGRDGSCMVYPGEHSSIRSVSHIPYHFAEVMKVKDIEDKVRDGIITMGGEISENLLKKIQDGAKVTKNIKRGLKRFFQYF